MVSQPFFIHFSITVRSEWHSPVTGGHSMPKVHFGHHGAVLGGRAGKTARLSARNSAQIAPIVHGTAAIAQFDGLLHDEDGPDPIHAGAVGG